MCYNNMYALKIGDFATSRMGHDSGRLYIVVAMSGADFVLVADGQRRKIENPKLKRIKHLKFAGESNLGELTDIAIAKAIKSLSKK